MKRHLLLSLAMLVISAGLSRSALADSITLTLDTPSQTAIPGQTIGFSGTVTALSSNSGDFFLNGDTPFVFPPLTIDDGPFLLSSPPSLAPGHSFSGLLFKIMVPNGTPLPQTYLGTFTILGGADGTAFTPAASVNFSTMVVSPTAPTPEPSSWLLMGTGLVGVITLGRSKRNTIFPSVKMMF